MSLRTRKQTLGVKTEGTAGTAETITGSEIILVDNINLTVDSPALETNHLSSTLSKTQSVAGRTTATITFDVLMYGASAAGTAPFWGTLMQACGMSETVTGSTSVEYLPASASIDTITIKRFMDGKSYQIIGCRGTWDLAANAGEFPVLSFSFQGIYEPNTDADAVKDEALLEGTSLPSFLPEKYQNANLTVGATYLATVESMSLSINNTLSVVPDANISEYKRVDITDREPSGELNVEAVTIATHDFEDEVHAKTALAITNYIGSNATGNGTGTLNTMTDATKNWPLDKWNTSYSVRDSAGTSFAITDTTATTVVVSGTPASGNYTIYKPGKMIIITVPVAQLQSQSESDSDGRQTQGIPYMCKKSASTGNDEISILSI